MGAKEGDEAPWDRNGPVIISCVLAPPVGSAARAESGGSAVLIPEAKTHFADEKAEANTSVRLSVLFFLSTLPSPRHLLLFYIKWSRIFLSK